MTAGERAVWAAEFVRHMAPFRADAKREIGEAVRSASAKVAALREAPWCATSLGRYTTEEREMLDEMLRGEP